MAVVLDLVQPSLAGRRLGGGSDNLEADMARDLGRDGRAGELEVQHWDAREIAQGPPDANPWRVERADLRHLRGAPMRGHFSRRDWAVYIAVVALTLAVAAALAFLL